MKYFPSFVVSICLWANKGKWNTMIPQGILNINGHNILIYYYSDTEAYVATPYTTRNTNTNVQNTKAMYHCLKSFISSSLKHTSSSQAGNLTNHGDCRISIAIYALLPQNWILRNTTSSFHIIDTKLIHHYPHDNLDAHSSTFWSNSIHIDT